MLGVVIAFLLGAAVGLLVAWYPSRQQIQTCQTQIEQLQSTLNQKERRLREQEASTEQTKEQMLKQEQTIRDMEAQLDWRQQTINQLKEALAEREDRLQTLEPQATAAKSATVEVKRDDLKRIEGIGPRIAKLLQDAGIVNFEQLAATEVDRLRQILEDAELLALADPSTWSEQASLAAAGDSAALEALQEKLKGGRRA
jgi:predicted flap endonuclease-1-like 5' DNA nuclease